MDGLFSHAEPPRAPEPTLPVGTVRVDIPGDAVQAAEGFLDYLHLWWPVSLYSVTGAGAQLWWQADGLVEEAEDGWTHLWGRTTHWDPPLGMSVAMALPGAEQDEWSVEISPGGVNAVVSFSAPLPRRLPQDPAADVPGDLWQQVMGFYARFMGVSSR